MIARSAFTLSAVLVIAHGTPAIADWKEFDREESAFRLVTEDSDGLPTRVWKTVGEKAQCEHARWNLRTYSGDFGFCRAAADTGWDKKYAGNDERLRRWVFIYWESGVDKFDNVGDIASEIGILRIIGFNPTSEETNHFKCMGFAEFWKYSLGLYKNGIGGYLCKSDGSLTFIEFIDLMANFSFQGQFDKLVVRE